LVDGDAGDAGDAMYAGDAGQVGTLGMSTQLTDAGNDGYSPVAMLIGTQCLSTIHEKELTCIMCC